MPGEMNGFDKEESLRVSNSFFSQNIFARQEGTNELNAAVPQLHQLLHNERLSPELLPFQFRLVDSITKQLSA